MTRNRAADSCPATTRGEHPPAIRQRCARTMPHWCPAAMLADHCCGIRQLCAAQRACEHHGLSRIFRAPAPNTSTARGSLWARAGTSWRCPLMGTGFGALQTCTLLRFLGVASVSLTPVSDFLEDPPGWCYVRSLSPNATIGCSPLFSRPRHQQRVSWGWMASYKVHIGG